MTWDEYYEKFYDWSTSTQINKLSSVEHLGSSDEELIKQLIEQSMDSFSKSDLESMDGIVDDDILIWIYKTKGLPIPEELNDCFEFDEALTNQNNISSKNAPGGFFSKLAMLFGIGSGISSGIEDGRGKTLAKFSVGDHVKVNTVDRKEGLLI